MLKVRNVAALCLVVVLIVNLFVSHPIVRADSNGALASSNRNITFEIDKTNLTVNEEAVIRIYLHEDPYRITDAEIVLRSMEQLQYHKRVKLERVGNNVLEGILEVDHSMPPGVFDIQKLLLYRQVYPDYHEWIGSDIYYPDYWNPVDYLPENFLTVYNTSGYHPEIKVEFLKKDFVGDEINVFLPNDTLVIKLDTNDDIFNIEKCFIEVGIRNNYGFNHTKEIELEKFDNQNFVAEIEIHDHFKDGAYSISKVKFVENDETIIIDNKKAYDFPLTFIADTQYFLQPFHSTFYVEGTTSNNIKPKIVEIKHNDTQVSRNGKFEFTIVMGDNPSGIYSLDLVIAKRYGREQISLKPVGANTFIGEFSPSPFTNHNGRWYFERLYLKDLTLRESQYSFGSTSRRDDYRYIEFQVLGFEQLGEIYGSNRYNTAAEISKNTSDSKTVIIASGVDFPDALSAGPLAAIYDAPILLTSPERLSANTMSEIVRRNPERVVLLGGSAAISENIETALITSGFTDVTRIQGENRYTTSVSIAREIFGNRNQHMADSEEIFLVSGTNFPDALSISSVASIQKKPILLTNPNRLHVAVQSFIVENGIQKVTVIGGGAAIKDSVVDELLALGLSVDRIYGSNRYETSATIWEKYFPKSRNAFVVNGLNFADALSAGPLAAEKKAPIVLTRPTNLPPVIDDYLSNINRTPVDFVTIIGGEAAVSISVKKVISEKITSK